MKTYYCYTHLCGIIIVRKKYNFFTHCILYPTCTAVQINTFRQLRFNDSVPRYARNRHPVIQSHDTFFPRPKLLLP